MSSKKLLQKALELSNANNLEDFFKEILTTYVDQGEMRPKKPNVENAIVWKLSDKKYILKKGSVLNKPSRSLLNHQTYGKYIREYIDDGYLSADGLKVLKDITASGSSVYSYVLGYPTRPKIEDKKYGL